MRGLPREPLRAASGDGSREGDAVNWVEAACELLLVMMLSALVVALVAASCLGFYAILELLWQVSPWCSALACAFWLGLTVATLRCLR